MKFDGRHLFAGLLALAFVAGGGATGAFADAASTEDTAKFLAGLPVSSGSPLAALEASSAARQHEAFFNATFQRVDRTQIDKVRAWASAHVDVRRETLFYFFSGPDFLYANAFFPDAKTYVLAGLESPGPVPDLLKLPPKAVPQALQGLEKSLRSILGLSFFQTKYMSGEFYYNPIRGTIPVLYIFMARSGKEVHSATLVQLDENGEISTDVAAPRKGAAKGVKITFSSPGGPEQTLYYFSANVAVNGFKTSGLEAFCDKLGRGDAFIKSASYLLQGRDFAGIRNFILNHSDAILQDDTGVPIYLFNKTWTLTPYGRYVGPIPLFRRAFQPPLAALHRNNKSQLIDFSIGYRYRPNEASLVWAVKQPSAEESKPAEKPAAKTPATTPSKAAEPAKPETPKTEPSKAEPPKTEAPKTESPPKENAAPDSTPKADAGPDAAKPTDTKPTETKPESAAPSDTTVVPKDDAKPR